MKEDQLNLIFLDNLSKDSMWRDALSYSFKNWSNPHLLPSTLSMSLYPMSTNLDQDCPPLPDKIVVCDDDYGSTKWKGVNLMYLNEDTRIVASLVKFNNFYGHDMDAEEKLYTCCHELGHGIGLRHWDEDFANQDLYNCMDYTNNHANNMFPDQSNFQALRNMYKGVSRRNLKAVGTTMDKEKERLLRRDLDKYLSQSIDLNTIDLEVWKVIETSDHDEVYQRRLDNGYSIRASFLLA